MTMIIPGIRTTAAGPIVQPKGPQTLGQADFLALMTAQLKNQDPTKPVDNTEYVAQMAQFSMVAGVSESNATLSRIAASLDTLLARSFQPEAQQE